MATKARAITNFYERLSEVQNDILHSAEKGNNTVFTNVPLQDYHGMRKTIEQAGFEVARKGDVTMNGKYETVIKIEW